MMLDQRLPSPRAILAGSAPPPSVSSSHQQQYPPINPHAHSPCPPIDYTFPSVENRYQTMIPPSSQNHHSYPMQNTGSTDSAREMSRSSSPEPYNTNVQSP